MLLARIHRKILAATILLLACTSAHPQDRYLSRELAVIVENDYPFETDQYYTAGLDLFHRFVISSDLPILNNNDSSKTIFSLHYGLKVFTPRDVDTQLPQLMDRPYCGWNFISADVLNFRKKNSGNYLMIQAGLVGNQSGMAHLQEWVHETIGLYSIYGWDSQIANEVVVNANFNHIHQFLLSKNIDLISSTGAWAGTGSNKITQELTLRLLKFNPLNQSAFLNSRISKTNAPRNEFYFFASLEGNYVLSNIFIEGSLFNNPSPFTTSINPWLFAQKIGIQYSGKKVSAAFSITHLGRETPFVTTHNYSSIRLAYRF